MNKCSRKCSECKDSDHHWIADYNERNGAVMICKHCPAWKYDDRQSQEPLQKGIYTELKNASIDKKLKLKSDLRITNEQNRIIESQEREGDT